MRSISSTATRELDSCEGSICKTGPRRFDRRWLERCSAWQGRVEQVFSKAAIVEPIELGPRLTVVEAGQGLVPYGLCLEADSSRLAVGDQLVLEGRFLSVISAEDEWPKLTLLGPGVSLGLPEAYAGGSLAALHQHVLWLERFADLPGNPDGSLAGFESHVASLLAERLSALVEMLYADRPDCDLNALVCGLAGLGFGSTPSGDDLLVGVTACCARFVQLGWFSEVRLEALRQVLRGLKPERTTRVGYEMIVQSSDGAFIEALLTLVGVLGCPKTERLEIVETGRSLCCIGGHSGTDMLSGVLAVANRRLASHEEVFEK